VIIVNDSSGSNRMGLEHSETNWERIDQLTDEEIDITSGVEA
jgi:hypothetical protein